MSPISSTFQQKVYSHSLLETTCNTSPAGLMQKFRFSNGKKVFETKSPGLPIFYQNAKLLALCSLGIEVDGKYPVQEYIPYTYTPYRMEIYRILSWNILSIEHHRVWVHQETSWLLLQAKVGKSEFQCSLASFVL